MTQTDIVLIPGGFGIDAILNNHDLTDWLQEINGTTK